MVRSSDVRLFGVDMVSSLLYAVLHSTVSSMSDYLSRVASLNPTMAI